jgi:hypothetical protein
MKTTAEPHVAPLKVADAHARLKIESRQICPCLSMKALHIGSCLFAGTTVGAYLGGVIGAGLGAVFGLAVGIIVITHQTKTPS